MEEHTGGNVEEQKDASRQNAVAIVHSTGSVAVGQSNPKKSKKKQTMQSLGQVTGKLLTSRVSPGSWNCGESNVSGCTSGLFGVDGESIMSCLIQTRAVVELTIRIYRAKLFYIRQLHRIGCHSSLLGAVDEACRARTSIVIFVGEEKAQK